MIIFSAIFLVGFLVLAFKRLDWALMFLLAALPAYLIRFSVLGLPFTLLEGMILISFAVWFLKNTRFKDFLGGKYKVKDFLANSPFSKKVVSEKRFKYPFGVEIILLLFISLLATALGGSTPAALGIWKAYFFEPVLLFILVINIFQGKKDLERVIWALGCGALGVAAWAIVQKLTGLGIENPLWAAEGTRRVVSFFGYPNAVGLYLAPLVALLLGAVASSHQETHPFLCVYPGKFIKEKCNWATSKTKAFLLFISILSVLAIFYAHSEGAIIGLVAAFIVCGLLGNKRTRLVVLSFVVVAIVAIAIIPGGIKLAQQKLTLNDFSGQVRKAQWAETWQMLKGGNRIITGAGLANYQKAIESYHVPGIFYNDGTDKDFRLHVVFNDDYKKKVWRPVEIYLYPHNIVLNFWTELGLVGVLLFVWLFVKIIQYSISSIQYSKKNKDNAGLFLALGILGTFIVIIVHGLVDVPYFKNDLACMFWVLIALLSLLKLQQKNLSN